MPVPAAAMKIPTFTQTSFVQVTTEPDLDLGRAFYVVSGFGTLTFEQSNFGVTDMAGEYRLHVHYGRHVSHSDYVSTYNGPLPEAPKPYGVQLVGGAVFDPAKAETADRGWWWTLPVNRWSGDRLRGGGRAPAGTCKRVCDVVLGITRHHMTRPDRAAIDFAAARRRAPGRIAERRSIAGRLREKITGLEAQLAAEERVIAEQEALLAGTEQVGAPA